MAHRTPRAQEVRGVGLWVLGFRFVRFRVSGFGLRDLAEVPKGAFQSGVADLGSFEYRSYMLPQDVCAAHPQPPPSSVPLPTFCSELAIPQLETANPELFHLKPRLQV